VNRSELESKHLAELHELAVGAGISDYRKLSRSELIEKLADGEGDGAAAGGPERPRRGGERKRRPREGRPRERGERGRRDEPGTAKPAETPKPEPQAAPATTPPPARGRRRRRRRFRRKRRELRLHELLLPPAAGRQAIVSAESREACTRLLREIATGLSAASKGPDPVAVLVDPSPEELADWRRDAPRAEIVAAGQERHVEDALAQAAARASAGEDVVVLVDSLSRFVAAYGDAEAAEDILEPGPQQGSGSLTVVAALERSA
jgi:transcription termination factor Rho